LQRVLAIDFAACRIRQRKRIHAERDRRVLRTTDSGRRPCASAASPPDREAKKGHAADAPFGDDVERRVRERVEPSIELAVLIALFERQVRNVAGAFEGADGLDQRVIRQQFRSDRRTSRIDPQAAAVERRDRDRVRRRVRAEPLANETVSLLLHGHVEDMLPHTVTTCVMTRRKSVTRMTAIVSQKHAVAAWARADMLPGSLPETGRCATRYAAEKAAVLRMEFKTFLHAFILIPVQVVRTSRRLVFVSRVESLAGGLFARLRSSAPLSV